MSLKDLDLPFRVFFPLGKGTHVRKHRYGMSDLSFHYYLVYMKNHHWHSSAILWFSQFASLLLLRGSLLTSLKFKRSIVLQLHEKRMLQLWPQQIIPKLCCWSIHRMSKPFHRYLLWCCPWHCPRAPCKEHAGAIQAILGLLAFLGAVCQTDHRDCATENSNWLDMCF